MIEIKQEDGEKRGRFVAYSDGVEVGEMTYAYSGPVKVTIDHTFVEEQMRGQNVARLLLDKAAGWMRDHKLSLIPSCPYVKEEVKRHPDLYGDLL